jgi:hypothetical protein
MPTEHGISLADIAGATPQVSTFADVLRLLGTDYEVEQLPPHQTKRRTLPAKLLLHFPGPKVVTVFLDPGGELSAEALVTVVGAEEGSPLRTADGLHVGMAMAEAEEVITRGYRVRDRFSGSVEVVAADGSGENFLALHGEGEKVAFIGLYRRAPGGG